MSYEVLARKWRPQQFEDVVGQDHVTRTLQNAITSGRMAHAYLFVGPRGTGKTSMARIFAKALNCAEGPVIKPCDKCDSCREIMGGTNLDVLEIDGASNNGVEQVRDLRETVKYTPMKGTFKIYVIDEVHMLSTPAFNALLKTLEEPPPHVKFIFATTEPQKILATILSRCQRFDLRRIAVPLIVERLKMVATAEGVETEEHALLAIARGAEGSLRDAESALDQIISFKGKNISEEDVLSVFGLVAQSTLEGLAEAVLEGDVKHVVTVVAELDRGGKDMQRAVIELLEHFRNLLVFLSMGDNAGQLDIAGDQLEILARQAALTDMARCLRIADILTQTQDRLRYALSKRTLFETALIRCSRASVVVSIEKIMKEIDSLKSNLCETAQVQVAPAVEKIEQSETVAEKPMPEPETKMPQGDEIGMLTGKWHEIVEKVSKIAVLAKNYLLDAKPLSVESNRVVIGFDREFADVMERAKAPRDRKALQHVLGQVLGRQVTVEFCEVAGIDSGEPADGQEPEKKAQSQREWVKEPAVQKVLDVFEGRIVEVRD